jgi:hypothetical protein
MKRRIYPILRPPVEDEPEHDVREWPRGEEVTETWPRPVVRDERATEAARTYRCPSHGRSQRATASRDGRGWRFEGLCCREAEAEVRARLGEQGE